MLFIAWVAGARGGGGRGRGIRAKREKRAWSAKGGGGQAMLFSSEQMPGISWE